MKNFKSLLIMAVAFVTPGTWCQSANGMALIKLTAFVDAISGSVRGSVFAKNKGGSYVRGKGVVSNPQTQFQSAVRSVFASISQAWRNLTAAQRSAWNSAVSDYPYQSRLGETKQLSGFALHQKLNLNLHAAGDSPTLQAPLAPAEVTGLEDLEAVVDVGAGDEITITTNTGGTIPAEMKYVVFATPSLSAGVTNVNKQYRKIGVATGSGLGGLQGGFDAKSIYEAKFGVPSEGETIGFKCRPINTNTGQDGAEISVLATVVST